MMNMAHALEVALLLLAAYLAGCILGYAAHRLWRARYARPAPAASSVVVPPPSRSPARRLAGIAEPEQVPQAAPIAAATRQRPRDLPAPRPGGADDLKQIKGIGAKTESALNDLGIYHFDQIAAWTRPNVEWLEGRIAVRGRIAREQWIEQATLLSTATRAA